jgi:hypothetical protein
MGPKASDSVLVEAAIFTVVLKDRYEVAGARQDMEEGLREFWDKEEEKDRCEGILKSWTELLLRTAFKACDEQRVEGLTATGICLNIVSTK